MVGSSQCRCRPTSTSRPSRRSSRRNITCCGRVPGSGGSAATPRSISCQAVRRSSARRRIERQAASMRLRIAASSSSASSSSRAPSRSASVRNGAARRARLRPRVSAASARPGPAGNRSHSSLLRAPGSASPWVRARTWRRATRRNASDGFWPAGLQAGEIGRLVVQARRPARRRQGARRLQRRVQRRFQRRPAGHQLLQAPAQAAGARASALGAEQPAAQLGRLDAGEFGGEGAVGGVEHVVALVEHVAHRHRVVVDAAPGRLRHHQGMVGHHQLGAAGAADGVLDEAAPPVRAGGVDALAAPVGEPAGQPGAEQLGKPARQVAALDVAVAGGQRPARHQAERHRRGRRGDGRGVHRVLEIEQAQIVLAPLAHHHAAAALRRVAVQPGQLRLDLALQMAGEGGNPHRALVALGPQAGRGDVAERLAGAGAGLGEHDMRVAAGLARGEGGGGGGGVVGLARPLLGARPQHGGQPRPRLGGRDRVAGRRRQRRHFLPFRQPPPDPQRLAAGAAPFARPARPAPAPPSPSRPGPSGAASAAASRLAGRSRPAASRASSACARSGSSAAAAAGPGRGGGMSTASARPRGVGAAARAGSTKANSSSRSRQGIARSPSRRSVAGACTSNGGGRLRSNAAAAPDGEVEQLAVRGENGGAAHPGHDRRRRGQQDARSRGSVSGALGHACTICVRAD